MPQRLDKLQQRQPAMADISQQFLKLLSDIFAFFTRWQLDNILTTTQGIYQMVTNEFSDTLPRQVYSLEITVEDQIAQCYFQQSKDDPKQHILTNRLLELCEADKTIRSKSTKIEFNFECQAMHLFKESFLRVGHVWEGEHLYITINPLEKKKDIAYFQKLFLFESGLTNGCSSLVVKDFSDCYPYLNPFDHVDLRECNNLTVYAPDATFDPQEIVAFLHDYEKSTCEYTTERELCFVFREDNEHYEVVYALMRLLIQRFVSDGRRRTYTLSLLNCYGDLAIGYGANTLHSNDRTQERLRAQRGLFLDKRVQLDLPARPENPVLFDIKIIRAPKPASMVVKVEN